MTAPASVLLSGLPQSAKPPSLPIPAPQVADTISELKLGNGTSVLIFANIASALPSSVGAAVVAAGDGNVGALAAYILAFLLTTLGIVYVQEAERQIPMAYGSRYKAGGPLSQQAYLPFKVWGRAAWMGATGLWCRPQSGHWPRARACDPST